MVTLYMGYRSFLVELAQGVTVQASPSGWPEVGRGEKDKAVGLKVWICGLGSGRGGWPYTVLCGASSSPSLSSSFWVPVPSLLSDLVSTLLTVCDSKGKR